MRKINIHEAVKYGLSGDRILELASDKLLDTSDAEVLLETTTWLVAIPHTFESFCEYSQNTNWVEAGKTAFEKYTEASPLTVFINKNTGEKYLAHGASTLIRTREDEELDSRNIEDFPSSILAEITEPIELEEGLGNILYRAGQGVANLARGARNLAVGFGAEARGIPNKTIDDLLAKLGAEVSATTGSAASSTPPVNKMINYMSSIIKAGQLHDYNAIIAYRNIIKKYYVAKVGLKAASQWDPQDLAMLVKIYRSAGGV